MTIKRCTDCLRAVEKNALCGTAPTPVSGSQMGPAFPERGGTMGPSCTPGSKVAHIYQRIRKCEQQYEGFLDNLRKHFFPLVANAGLFEQGIPLLLVYINICYSYLYILQYSP